GRRRAAAVARPAAARAGGGAGAARFAAAADRPDLLRVAAPQCPAAQCLRYDRRMTNETSAAAAEAAGPAVRAVIADDERLMREQLRARLAEVWPELQIVGEAKNGLEAVELVQQQRHDLVFLDIRMP